MRKVYSRRTIRAVTICILLATVSTCYFAGWIIMTWAKATAFSSTSGTVLSTAIKEDAGRKLFHPQIEYTFVVNNRGYHSSIYSLIPFEDQGSDDWAKGVVKQYPPGTKCIVYYSPSEPSRCGLSRSLGNRSLAVSLSPVIAFFALFRSWFALKRAESTHCPK